MTDKNESEDGLFKVVKNYASKVDELEKKINAIDLSVIDTLKKSINDIKKMNEPTTYIYNGKMFNWLPTKDKPLRFVEKEVE